RAMPFFKAMGKAISHIGGHGDGQSAKIVNQILVVGNALAMCEALLFGQAAGLVEFRGYYSGCRMKLVVVTWSRTGNHSADDNRHQDDYGQ
ncbi:MAG: NAD-binding protein, partial [Planctomycetota bacterium]|nr:NAD-binding protein [Planctomycetota bacterium]